MNIFDVHIKNGEVIDGTGAPKFKSDIVIDKGKIIGFSLLKMVMCEIHQKIIFYLTLKQNIR